MLVRLIVVQGRQSPHALDLEAPSAAAARQSASAMGYSVLSSRVEISTKLFAPRSRRREFDVLVFTEQIRDLLMAGLSIIESLDALQKGADAAPAAAIEHLTQQLREGNPLSDALASQGSFPALLVSLVRASEQTSNLPESLTRYLSHERQLSEVRHRLVSTAIYPALLMGVGCLVLAFLLLYVMPRFARIFEGMTGELPWSAKAMLAWAHVMNAGGGSIAAAVCLSGVLLAGTLASREIRSALLSRLLGLQPVRLRLQAHFLSRWYRATGLLLQGGIALPQAIGLATDLLPTSLRAGSATVLRLIEDGVTPSEAYSVGSMATPVAEHLLLAGERTGELGSILIRIAQFHETAFTRELERTMRVLEPLVMVLIGLGVGIVVVLMYLPIFELASAIQ